MAIKSGVRKTRDNSAQLTNRLKNLTGLDVLVGVPSDKAERDEDGDTGPINNAQLAYIHTYGATIKIPSREATVGRNGGKFATTKKATSQTSHVIPEHEVVIPARPFLQPGIKRATPKTMPHLKKAAQLALQGDKEGAKSAMTAAGLEAVSAVRAVMTDGIAPPLAQSTLRARRARGRAGETPLLDKHELINSISSVVREK